MSLGTQNTVPVADLRVGDRVLSENDEIERVFFFSHADPYATPIFLQIQSESGHAVNLTGGHLVPVLPRSNLREDEWSVKLRPARMVQLGDRVRVQSTTGQGTIWSRVTGVDLVKGGSHNRGIYNPHTPSGKLVVNGVLVSCYTSSVPVPTARRALSWLNNALQTLPPSLHGPVSSAVTLLGRVVGHRLLVQSVQWMFD